MKDEDKPVGIPGRYGGTLIPQKAGNPALPGAGRKKNFFKQHIQELATGEMDLIVKGRLVDDKGDPYGEPVSVMVNLPGAFGVVLKAYKQAAKGDAQARKWLTETGWGKAFEFNSGADPDNPAGGGFVLVLPPNGR